jgi:hypothetical protein
MAKKAHQSLASELKLTQKQQLFAEYLADPDNVETPEEFAQRIGVKTEILNRWKTNPSIVQTAFQICRVRMGAELPKVLRMLLENALGNNDISACKLFFQQLDKITEAPEETGLTVDKALELINRAVDERIDRLPKKREELQC